MYNLGIDKNTARGTIYIVLRKTTQNCAYYYKNQYFCSNSNTFKRTYLDSF